MNYGVVLLAVLASGASRGAERPPVLRAGNTRAGRADIS